MVTTKLCKQLGLKVLPYDGTYTLANGAKEKYAGELAREMLQLHDKLLLEIDNIHVMEANYIGAILGTGILGDSGALVRTANTDRDGDTTYLTLEVGARQWSAVSSTTAQLFAEGHTACLCFHDRHPRGASSIRATERRRSGNHGCHLPSQCNPTSKSG